jgi:hypothetical protein
MERAIKMVKPKINQAKVKYSKLSQTLILETGKSKGWAIIREYVFNRIALKKIKRLLIEWSFFLIIIFSSSIIKHIAMVLANEDSLNNPSWLAASRIVYMCWLFELLISSMASRTIDEKYSWSHLDTTYWWLPSRLTSTAKPRDKVSASSGPLPLASISSLKYPRKQQFPSSTASIDCTQYNISDSSTLSKPNAESLPSNAWRRAETVNRKSQLIWHLSDGHISQKMESIFNKNKAKNARMVYQTLYLWR